MVLEVEDNGSGMDEKTQLRVFEPFFTTKAPNQGMGLGLSISYGIVEDYGGRITCVSRRSEGTTFQLRLPARVAEGDSQTGRSVLRAAG